MEVCYCANFYSSIRCTNTVFRFGDRCRLCTLLKSGASVSPGLLPDDCHCLVAHADEERDDKSYTSSNTSRRPSWTFAGFSFSPLASKVSLSPGGWRKALSNQKT